MKNLLTAILITASTLINAQEIIRTPKNEPIWKYGQKELEYKPNGAYTFSYDDLGYTYLSSWGFVYFKDKEALKVFLEKTLEVFELPYNGTEHIGFVSDGTSIRRIQGFMGVKQVFISRDGKYTTLSPMEVKGMLKSLDQN